MQKVQQNKRLERREDREADTSRVRVEMKKKGYAKIYCLREKVREKKKRVGASDKDGKASAAYKSTWMNPHNCNCPSSLTPDRSSRCTHMYACVRTSVRVERNLSNEDTCIRYFVIDAGL